LDKLYVARSKRSGHYFCFVEYCDDGWGSYEDNTSPNNPSCLQIFTHYQIEKGLKPHESYYENNAECCLVRGGITFRNHTKDEIEFVEIKIG
jgi:hypothetical protein